MEKKQLTSEIFYNYFAKEELINNIILVTLKAVTQQTFNEQRKNKGTFTGEQSDK